MSINKKSGVWKYFTDEEDKRVKCKLCGQQLSVSNKSTCSLIRHMDRRHQYRYNRNSRQEHLEEEVLINIEDNSRDLIKPLPMKKQRLSNQQVIKIIVQEYHPFSIVEEVKLKRVYPLNANYKLLTSKTIFGHMSVRKKFSDKKESTAQTHGN
ncbi:PREDICTED: uncharacterized protein LOC108356036, partial [Rhagoletis zephyria]|uniref:uncharacterized protein LOC108356036 n=1 Tax=Rhagoletis zephyria TaxID=28612 RepID=UPI000811548B